MPIQKIARIRIEPRELDGKNVVYVETKDENDQWKLRALCTTTRGVDHGIDEYPNEYIHVFVVQEIQKLLKAGYSFV